MTRNEINKVKKAIEICYVYGHDYTAGYLENVIDYYDTVTKSDHKKPETITPKELSILSDVISICDKYNYYGTGDLLFNIVSTQVNGGDYNDVLR